MSTQLAKQDPRDIDLGTVRLTATGITFTARPTLDQWRAAFQWMHRCEHAVQWWIGDMINQGENIFGEEASCEFEPVSSATHRRWAWVASKVPSHVRRENIPYSHHEKVARFDPVDQARWLDLAEKNGWTSKKLAREIAEKEQINSNKPDTVRCPICGKLGWDGHDRSLDD